MKPGVTSLRIEPVDLDQKGYGRDGSSTRREWQHECLKMLNSSRAEFLSWQAELTDLLSKQQWNRRPPSYDLMVSCGGEPPIRVQWPATIRASHFVLDLAGMHLSKTPNLSQYEFHLGVN